MKLTLQDFVLTILCAAVTALALAWGFYACEMALSVRDGRTPTYIIQGKRICKPCPCCPCGPDCKCEPDDEEAK